jgi:hypothetical protein
MIAYDPFQLSITKRFPRSVLGFRDAVGVEQEAIGWFDRHAAHRILRVRFDTEQQTVAFDTLHFTFRISPAQ